jgi:predicted transcriptional regulator
MKRDMDLIRNILLELEKKESATSWVTISIDGYTDDQVNYHIGLLSEAGFIEAKKYSDGLCMVRNLTWKGHEFLENAKNDTIWIKTKEFIKEKGGSVSLGVMTEILKKIALKHFNLE